MVGVERREVEVEVEVEMSRSREIPVTGRIPR
jgi:hypothetical protein